jgi:hypothetical protein
MNRLIFYFKLFLWLSLAIFVAWLFWQNIIPNGRVVYLLSKDKTSDFIGQFEPASRLQVIDKQIKISGSLVYFTIRTPRPFDKLKLTINYQPENQDLIEVGLLRNEQKWNYEVRPLYSRLLDNLYQSKDWGSMETDQTIFLQRQETYDSLKQFLAKPPAKEAVAVYNYNLSKLQTKTINSDFVLDNQINYIVANYQVPKIMDDGSLSSEVEFDLRQAPRAQDAYKIMISIPGLKNNPNQTENIKIKSIQAELEGKTLREFF